MAKGSQIGSQIRSRQQYHIVDIQTFNKNLGNAEVLLSKNLNTFKYISVYNV